MFVTGHMCILMSWVYASTSDSSRLMMMDRRDFNKLGVSIDELVEGYIQTILSVIAIDKMAIQLINQKGKLRNRLFQSLNEDQALINEIKQAIT